MKSLAILIPTFNRPDKLKVLISSAVPAMLSDRYDVRLIIRNDSDKGDTELIKFTKAINNFIKTSKPDILNNKINYIDSKINVGIFCNRAELLSTAMITDTTYVMFCDDDDQLDFESIFRVLDKYHNYDIVWGDCIEFWSNLSDGNCNVNTRLSTYLRNLERYSKGELLREPQFYVGLAGTIFNADVFYSNEDKFSDYFGKVYMYHCNSTVNIGEDQFLLDYFIPKTCSDELREIVVTDILYLADYNRKDDDHMISGGKDAKLDGISKLRTNRTNLIKHILDAN